jgi:2-oxoglutarate ferredoxin oxidoreductase subunit gamma
MRIRLAGYGGQGQVTAGILLGHGVVAQGLNAMQTQSYGSSTRGGLTTCDVAVDDKEINEVHPDQVDVLVAMNQEAFEVYRGMLRPGGTLIYEEDLVKPPVNSAAKLAACPSTRLAKVELGRQVCGNVVMLGFLAGCVRGLVEPKNLEQAIRANLPQKVVDLNLRALALGLGHARASTEKG